MKATAEYLITDGGISPKGRFCPPLPESLEGRILHMAKSGDAVVVEVGYDVRTTVDVYFVGPHKVVDHDADIANVSGRVYIWTPSGDEVPVPVSEAELQELAESFAEIFG